MSLLLLFLEIKRGKHEREVAIISSVSCNIDAKAGRVLPVHIFFLFPVSSYFSSFFWKCKVALNLVLYSPPCRRL